MELQVIHKSDLSRFVENLLTKHQVEGVKKKEGSFYYGSIESPEELFLDFDCTLIPPKKYFLPPRETLFEFATAPSLWITPVIQDNPFILFGVHPYDLKAINQMDQIFANGLTDPHYLKRREGALLISVDPKRVAPRSFWVDMGAAAISNGFDLMFTDIGEVFVVEIGTEKGGNLISQYGKFRQATKDETLKRANARFQLTQLSRKWGLNFPKREIPKLLEQSKENLIWEEHASKCLSCGSCNLVCPTCYCFDVQDEMELDLVHGERFRRWDACLLQDFAKVATGENFRESRTARYRHRFFRKGLYLFRVLNDVACVGCGRCSASCLPDIADPVNLLNKLKEGERQGGI
ncbi:MAG: 4Fe-4S dicluster domain-containing protein [Deltaproteobacteria bacterium]|nr:MAG: 4Fe-4S dicluster domain-containing protein [Deltaproteobacteria bacterium]